MNTLIDNVKMDVKEYSDCRRILNIKKNNSLDLRRAKTMKEWILRTDT